MSEINVTPFVDVMLVLLIVFMVTAPLLTVGIPLDLPKVKSSPLTDQKEPVTISLSLDGSVHLNERLIPVENLIEILNEVTKLNYQTRIYIESDQSVSHGRVMDILSAIHALGYVKVAFVTDPLE